MTILAEEGAGYRTKLMLRDRAERFARCLAANGRYTGVAVQESKRTQKAERWYVTYRPTNAERGAALLQAEQDTRTVRAYTQGADMVFYLDTDGARPFHWCLSASGEVYEVDSYSCTCPDHQYRGRYHGLACKHMQALRRGLAPVVTIPAPIGSGTPADNRTAEERYAQAVADRKRLWD